MIPIYICEDDEMQRNKIVGYIEDYITIEHQDMRVLLAKENPTKLLDASKKKKESGLYFLDVALKTQTINGFELAKEIRKTDPRGFIVFITSHSEMSYLTFTYKIEAMDYIIKDDYDNIRKRVIECMESVSKRIDNHGNKGKYLTIKIDDRIIHEPLENVLFIETSPRAHKVILHSRNRQIEFYGKLREMESELDDRFYRTHRAFLVNQDHILEVDTNKNVIHMVNGEKCMVSTRKIKGLKK
ncbi:LytR/AlgR family response regulator transcription factor [Listeria grandensis]|uniref:LytR/AlgR family response regulator transcription factor n=1 Tax=Listeria grandensis TaxID=1494963 RepID=UPI00164DA965|nr:LytTR family DNA-binding domain-containing protein [Listeria grandensis]MBC6316624.1 response regulator transcription factor [Listeria grandensis]